MDTTRARELTMKLQAGQLRPVEEAELVKAIQRRYKSRNVKNYLYDKDEIEMAYLTKAWNALYRARCDIGNPIAYACNRGYHSVLDYFRQVNAQKLNLRCNECGYTMSYDHRNKSCKCCGSKHLKGVEKESAITAAVDRLAIVEATYVEAVMIDEVFTMCISIIRDADLPDFMKIMAEEAINYREDFADYYFKKYRNKAKANAFKEQIVEMLRASSDKNLTLV